jgi:hypothetical protein
MMANEIISEFLYLLSPGVRRLAERLALGSVPRAFG